MSNPDAKLGPNSTDGKPASDREQSADPGQQTWIGGGSEPVHPDDIGADGQYLPGDKPGKRDSPTPDAEGNQRQ